MHASTRAFAAAGFDAQCAWTYDGNDLTVAVASREWIAAPSRRNLADPLGSVRRHQQLRALNSGTDAPEMRVRRTEDRVRARLDLDVAERLESPDITATPGICSPTIARRRAFGLPSAQVHEAAALGVDRSAAAAKSRMAASIAAFEDEFARERPRDSRRRSRVRRRREASRSRLGEKIGRSRRRAASSAPQVVLVVEVKRVVVSDADAAPRAATRADVGAQRAMTSRQAARARNLDDRVEVEPLRREASPARRSIASRNARFVGRAEPEVALRKGEFGIAGNPPTMGTSESTRRSRSRCPRPPTRLQIDARDAHRRIEAREARRDRGDGARDAAGVDHEQHRRLEPLRDLGGRAFLAGRASRRRRGPSCPR